MSNKMYDFLSLLGRLILPAFGALFLHFGNIWGLPYSDKIPPTIMAVVVLLNSCLGISSANYYKKLANNVLEAEGVDPEAVEHHIEPTGEQQNDSVE